MGMRKTKPGMTIAGMTFARTISRSEARTKGLLRPARKTPVQGPAGLDGEPGEAGPRGLRGKAGAMGEQGPRGPKGDKGDKGERGERGAAGRDGKDGATWIQKDRAPTAKDGKNGDQWFRPSTCEVFLKEDDRWKVTATLKGRRGPVGLTGPAGRDGNRFVHGFGAPTGGRSGDSYLDLEIGDLYLKQRDGWRLIFDFGARAYVGNGAPTESPHDAGDILVGDEPASEVESEFDSEFDSTDSDSESDSDFDFG
jgi:hypothetical protein